jgi:hypothetical protein
MSGISLSRATASRALGFSRSPARVTQLRTNTTSTKQGAVGRSSNTAWIVGTVLIAGPLGFYLMRTPPYGQPQGSGQIQSQVVTTPGENATKNRGGDAYVKSEPDPEATGNNPGNTIKHIPDAKGNNKQRRESARGYRQGVSDEDDEVSTISSI